MKQVTFILLLFGNFLFAQNDEQRVNDSILDSYTEKDRIELKLESFRDFKFDKAYRIWTGTQVIELIKVNETSFNGLLVNFVTQRKKSNGVIISQKIKIPDKTVQQLILKLSSENIETLIDYSEIPNHPTGFDGINYVFEIGNEQKIRVYNYWCPEESFQNPQVKEIQTVRNILKAINSQFDLNVSFQKFIDRLPKGNYHYGMINMSKI